MKMDAVPRQSIVATMVVSDMYARIADKGICDLTALSSANIIGSYLTNLQSHYSYDDFSKAAKQISLLIYD